MVMLCVHTRIGIDNGSFNSATEHLTGVDDGVLPPQVLRCCAWTSMRREHECGGSKDGSLGVFKRTLQ